MKTTVDVDKAADESHKIQSNPHQPSSVATHETKDPLRIMSTTIIGIAITNVKIETATENPGNVNPELFDVRFAARPRVISENNRITPKTPRRRVANMFAMTSTAGGDFEKK